MPNSEREIVFTNDLDGVHFKTLPSVRTTLRLLRRVPLPEPGLQIGEYSPAGVKDTALSRVSVFLHSIRPINAEALEGLGIFKKIAQESQRSLGFAALSGRESDKHKLTEQRLRESGHMDYFTDLFLNQGSRSIPWKESVVQKLLEEGSNVVHIDDDLRAGLCIARMDEQRVLVYILRNLSNHPRLLRGAGVSIPPNLLIVPSFKDAAIDFAKRLSEGKL